MQEYPKDHWRIVLQGNQDALRIFQRLYEAAQVTVIDGNSVRVIKSPDNIAFQVLAEFGIKLPAGKSGMDYIEKKFIRGGSFMVLLFSICHRIRNIRNGRAIFETESAAKEFARSKGVDIEGGLPYVWLRRETNEYWVAGRYGPMMETWDLLERIAATDSTLLLCGESGTGKEVAARFVHQNSKRRNGSFVTINCGAIPEPLVESELFGHEKGAFTGAIGMRHGVLELAHDGTLFLDEIGDLPLLQQVKLLRVIQGEDFRRVGGMTAVKVNVRFIAATNTDLAHAKRTGKFREDLYYRLNVIPCTMPPLRDRVEDIHELVSHILGRVTGSEPFEISSAAMKKLESHTWPGNVRELENVIQRARILCTKGEIEPEHIITEVDSTTRPPISLESFGGRTLSEISKEVLLSTLAEFNGNRTHTAKALGITVRTVRNRLANYRKEVGLLLDKDQA